MPIIKKINDTCEIIAFSLILILYGMKFIVKDSRDSRGPLNQMNHSNRL
jgi:hypothetical protein